MSKKQTQEELDAIELKEYVEKCFKEMDEAMLEWEQEKQAVAAVQAEEVRAAERAAVNRQEGETMADRLAEEEEAKNA